MTNSYELVLFAGGGALESPGGGLAPLLRTYGRTRGSSEHGAEDEGWPETGLALTWCTGDELLSTGVRRGWEEEEEEEEEMRGG